MKTKAIATLVLTLFLASSIMAFNVGPVHAVTVDVAPDTLNINSSGNWISAYIEPSVSFKDNFDNTLTGNDPSGWTEQGVGTWTIEKDATAPSQGATGYGDVYSAKASSTYSTRDFSFMTVLSDFADGVFEFQFKLIDEAGVTERITIPVRYQDDSNWILFDVDTGINYGRDVYCIFVSKAGSWTQLARKDVTITKDVWHTMKIVTKGWDYEMWIDGVKELTATDSIKAFDSGKIGLGVYRNTHAHFDNVLVSDIDIKTVDVSTVKLWHMRFSDDFESYSTGTHSGGTGLGSWKYVSGTPSIITDTVGGLSTQVLGIFGGSYVGEAVAVVGSSDWQDYTLDLDVKKQSGGYFNIVFRYYDPSNYYLLEPSSDADHIALFKRVSGTFTELYKPRPTQPTVAGTWYHYRIELTTTAAGTNIKVFVDGVQKFDVTDNTGVLAKGSIGVGGYAGCEGRFDNIVVLSHIADAIVDGALINDYDSDGIPDMMVKFDRATVAQYINTNGLAGSNVELVITGKTTDGASFSGGDSVRVIAKGKVKV